MATKAKKTTKKATKKVNKPSVAKKVNTSLINASIATINTTVENGEKWQKLASKLIKKSEKIRKQQINMIFDTAEAVKGQFMAGTDRMKDLVGIDDELVEKAKDMAMKNPVSKKVVDIVEDITDKVSENPMVQKAEKATEELKDKSVAKFKEIKEDVLDQAAKIVHIAEDKIEDAKAELKKEAKKATPKKRTTKKAKATKTKAVAKKKVVKKTVAPKAKAKVTSKAATKKVTKTTKTAVVDDLKLINGIGPKTETVFNKNGIKTFAALAKLKTPAITTMLDKEGIRFAAVQVELWQKQAEVAVKDGVEGLAKWIENYKTS
jgi:predicted flap endonuclease-1-like 5' DNA nuclease